MDVVVVEGVVVLGGLPRPSSPEGKIRIRMGVESVESRIWRKAVDDEHKTQKSWQASLE